MLSVFSEFERYLLRERIKAGIAQAIKIGRPHGRPRSALKHSAKIMRLFEEGMTKAGIARKLKIGRTSVIRILSADAKLPNKSPKSRQNNSPSHTPAEKGIKSCVHLRGAIASCCRYQARRSHVKLKAAIPVSKITVARVAGLVAVSVTPNSKKAVFTDEGITIQ